MEKLESYYLAGLPEDTFGEPHFSSKDFLLLSQYSWIMSATQLEVEWPILKKLYRNPCETILLGAYTDCISEGVGIWDKRHIDYANRLGVCTYSERYDLFSSIDTGPRLSYRLGALKQLSNEEYVDGVFIDRLLFETRKTVAGKAHPVLFTLPAEISLTSVHAFAELKRICFYLRLLDQGEKT